MTPAHNTITLANTFFIFNSIIFFMTGWKQGSKGGRKAGGASGSGGKDCFSKCTWLNHVYVSVPGLAGIVQLLLKSNLLTGLFHDAAKGTLYFGQQPWTHLLKLASVDTWSYIINRLTHPQKH